MAPPRAFCAQLLALACLCCGVAPGGAVDPGQAAEGNQATGGQAGEANQSADANALQGKATLGPGANAQLLALKDAIEGAAAASGVAADVLAGVIWDESRADPTVAGGGLMQIGPDEFAAQKAAHPQVVGESTDAAANAMAGAFYLVQLQGVMAQKYKRDDLGITLRAYNSGENGVDPNDLSALPAGTGTAAYVTQVTHYIAIIASGTGSLPP